jgi:hypothetical protein
MSQYEKLDAQTDHNATLREAVGVLEDAGIPADLLVPIYDYIGPGTPSVSLPLLRPVEECLIGDIVPSVCPVCDADSAQKVNILSATEVQMRCPNGHLWTEKEGVTDEPSLSLDNDQCPYCGELFPDCECDHDDDLEGGKEGSSYPCPCCKEFYPCACDREEEDQ